MDYKEQMNLYIDNLENTIEMNNKEVDFLEKQLVFIKNNINYTKEINKSIVKNLKNAIKEMD